jgi:hypothetical protein
LLNDGLESENEGNSEGLLNDGLDKDNDGNSDGLLKDGLEMEGSSMDDLKAETLLIEMTAEGPATKEADDSEPNLELLLNSLRATDGLLKGGFEIDGSSIDLDPDGRANDGFSDKLKTLLDFLLLSTTLLVLATEDDGVARAVTGALLTPDLELDA